MATSFQVQFASDHPDSSSSSSSASGAGAGAGGGYSAYSTASGADAVDESSSSSSSAPEFDEAATQMLFQACQSNDINMATTAIANHANVNTVNNRGATLLAYAIRNNASLDMVQFLLEHGATASINKVDHGGFTPLFEAVYECNLNMVNLLLKAEYGHYQPYIDLSLPANLKALHWAIDSGDLPIVKAIIKSRSFDVQHVISLQDIVDSLQFANTNRDPAETAFNKHYPDLQGDERTAMIAWLQEYIEEHSNPECVW